MKAIAVLMITVLAGLGVSGPAAPAVAAASFPVNTESDAHDINPGDGRCTTGSGKCSLRAALEESNANPGTTANVVTLPCGKYILTLGMLKIKNSLNLDGAGSYCTIIDGNLGNPDENLRPTNIFFIEKGTDRNINRTVVRISGVAIQKGFNGPPFGGDFCSGTEFGTGLFVSEGTSLFLANSVVNDNQSEVGGVGIANSGDLTLFQSTVRDNKLIGGGGGITGIGAGILNCQSPEQPQRAVLRIIESTISGNIGILGGGIWNLRGIVDIINSTISGNKASLGGGIGNCGQLNISFSTITNNEAGRKTGEPLMNRVGGGIRNFGVPASGKCAEGGGRVSIGNTILAGNTDNRSTLSDPLAAPDCFTTGEFNFTSFRGNLVGILNSNCNLQDAFLGHDRSFDQVGTPENRLDPRLGPLANNGGPTETHALLPANPFTVPMLPPSPAIDHGTGVTSSTFFNCPPSDQRGTKRPQGKACDVGAFEFKCPIGSFCGSK